MLAFKNYAINEYKIENIASVSFKFTHSLTTSLDKKTNELMNKHAINVAIKLFDKDLNLLHKHTHTLSFPQASLALSSHKLKDKWKIKPSADDVYWKVYCFSYRLRKDMW